MMSNPQSELRNLKPKHDFLVAIDSDGCVFDSMEIKQKECFIPNIIKHWNLQPVSKYIRTAAEFVNLYSQWRGINRFPAIIKTFDLLRDWEDVQNRNVNIPVAQPLRDWIERESKLGNPALKIEVEKTKNPVLEQALKWSEAVNGTVADMVYNVPPIPYVRECLEKIINWADIIVCSSTPIEALRREWKEHDIDRYANVIAGQEMGTKKEHIKIASNGKYEKDHVIMIGDAPGDLKAARANDVLFYPINPGEEEKSWEHFFIEGMEKFQQGKYINDYMDILIKEFNALLPEKPPWG